MKRKFEYVERIKSNGYQMNEIKFDLPKRSTKNSGGYDFFVPEDTVCKAHEITMVKSGVKAYFPDDEVLLLFNRSSNPKKKGLIILNGVGVVDSDYYGNPDNEGEMAGLFYNMLDEDVVLKAGEKMMQGVFVKYGITDDDNAEGIRTGGFGSTGK
jgi:dUTP pyrophosphatase